MKKLLAIALLFILGGTTIVSAQCPGIVSPEPTCIRVMPNGDVEVDYDVNSMGGPTPLDIDEFRLQHSNSGVVWTDVATVVVGASWPVPATLTDLATSPSGNQQNTNPAYYRIIAVCAGPPPFDLTESSVIQAVKLSHTLTNDFEVNLTWNWDQLSNNLAVTINRDRLPFVPPVWNAAGSPAYIQGTMNHTDTVVTCDDSLKYRIVLNNLSAVCQNISSIDGPFQVKDNTDPIQVTIDTITFDPVLNRPVVNWSPSSKDTKGYAVLYHSADDCLNYTLVDSVFGRNNTSLVDLTEWNENSVPRYTIIPFDECNRTGAPSACEAGIFLVPTLDICEKSVRLDWNHYNGFDSGTDVLYKIFVSIGSSNFVFVESTTDNFFLHADPIQNTILTYKVVAFEQGGLGPKTTTSNSVEVDAEFLKLPKMQYLRYSSVSQRNQIRLELYTDIESDAHTYHLKRSYDTSGAFLTVNVFDAPDRKIPADSIVPMTDNDPQTDMNQYFYKVEIFDSCGASMSESNIASSVLLRATPNHTTRVNRLEWSNVFGWEGGTFSYKIHRSLDGVPVSVPLTKFPDSGATTVFYDSLLQINDNITSGNPSRGNYCYVIEAVENDPSFPGLKPAKSFSNEVCVVQEPYASIPNAFTPNGDGKNERYKPIVTYHDITSYEFFVMNRYGEVIYQTTNVDAYWDGTYGGNPSPEGVYVYTLKYRSSTGQSFEDVGTITLVR